MGSTFNAQILVEKLAKLNSSQASIETLSHWCIFHMNKAKQVVETWAKQFHCSPREQRLAFLYLANDILQNSRRKGSEFVVEFWKVLPDALRDVVEHGDEFGRNAALRMISIWEDRKVFVSRGPLKEEFLGRRQESHNKNGKPPFSKMKQPIGNIVDKIVSGYQVVCGGQVDEDVILSKCRNAISYIEKVEKEIGRSDHPGQLLGSTLIKELQGQNATLRYCIDQLKAVESSRVNLVSHLREALQEQETKLAQMRNELQAAKSLSEHAGNICQQLLNHDNVQSHPEKNSVTAPPGFGLGEKEKSAPVMYTRQIPLPENPQVYVDGESHKSAAAAVAAKLTSSTSSAQMLSFVLSSLASEGVIGNHNSKEPASDFPPEKRPKLENPQPHSEPLAITNQELNSDEPPPPPPSPPPPLPPLPPMPPYQAPQYMPNTGTITSGQFSYFGQQPPPPTLLPYPVVGAQVTGLSPFATPPTNTYQGFQGQDGNFYNQPPMAPISRP